MNFATWLISWPFKHIRFIALLLVLSFIAYGVITCSQQGKTDKPLYLEKVPDTIYSIQTDSRVYYMNEYNDNGEMILLKGYYEFWGKEWVYRNQNLPLVKKYFTKELKVREN